MAELSMEAFTDTVIGAIGPKTTPRTRELMTALIRHMHDFAREVKLTTPEYLAACDFVVRIGQMSDDKRNEAILASDVFGLESLVDFLDHHSAERGAATESAVLGPFWRENSPLLPNGSSIVQGGKEGDSVLVQGRVLGVNGRPVKDALVAVWETSPNGLYEQQDPDQPEFNLRGQFRTDENGYYAFRALRPIAYPIPFDGPAGELLQMMDRHPFRPAHIHFRVRAAGYHELVTQIFDRDDQYLDSDSVFAVKNSLVVDFKPAPAGADTRFVVDYDIVLEPLAG
ncbi:catechol 1,2-dioxygenase [Plasticicumulans lactativorans]|uniref:Catechol 1,2-dioxygenase n=1 Tax=Plasticicumulans lactativorans TaxID=1133106 RepID=A0A4R2L2J5_9GAMM|nr:intradiol ring-cleavage dioxygenase [Plasticicumulans lactativorans]TCO81314.1 catechol 1,2-dioxygenase [Plasticicumulans lactativorans]